MATSWKRPGLFSFGAVGCVLLYLFLFNFPPLSLHSSTAGIVPAIVLAITTSWLTARFLKSDGLSPAVLGLGSNNRPIAHFVRGLLIGFVVTGFWLGIVAWVTGASWAINPTFSMAALGLGAVFYVFNNVGEELVYRGYLFVRLAATWGTGSTIVVTTVAFALLHLQAGIPWLSVLAGVLTSGLMFAAVFGRWRSLPLALGFHVATNVFQDVFGLRPSAASLLVADYPPAAAGMGPVILGAIALVNVAVAVALLHWPQRRPTLTPLSDREV